MLGRKKKKNKPLVNKKNLKNFLQHVTKSIDQNFSGQESKQLELILKGQLDSWFQNTIQQGNPLDAISVKVGVCLGILETLRKVNESQNKEKIGYIA